METLVIKSLKLIPSTEINELSKILQLYCVIRSPYSLFPSSDTYSSYIPKNSMTSQTIYCTPCFNMISSKDISENLRQNLQKSDNDTTRLNSSSSKYNDQSNSKQQKNILINQQQKISQLKKHPGIFILPSNCQYQFRMAKSVNCFTKDSFFLILQIWQYNKMAKISEISLSYQKLLEGCERDSCENKTKYFKKVINTMTVFDDNTLKNRQNLSICLQYETKYNDTTQKYPPEHQKINKQITQNRIDSSKKSYASKKNLSIDLPYKLPCVPISVYTSPRSTLHSSQSFSKLLKANLNPNKKNIELNTDLTKDNKKQQDSQKGFSTNEGRYEYVKNQRQSQVQKKRSEQVQSFQEIYDNFLKNNKKSNQMLYVRRPKSQLLQKKYSYCFPSLNSNKNEEKDSEKKQNIEEIDQDTKGLKINEDKDKYFTKNSTGKKKINYLEYSSQSEGQSEDCKKEKKINQQLLSINLSIKELQNLNDKNEKKSKNLSIKALQENSDKYIPPSYIAEEGKVKKIPSYETSAFGKWKFIKQMTPIEKSKNYLNQKNQFSGKNWDKGTNFWKRNSNSTKIQFGRDQDQQNLKL